MRIARGEPFDSPLILSVSKDERLAQDVLATHERENAAILSVVGNAPV
jgi:hypothetical protein